MTNSIKTLNQVIGNIQNGITTCEERNELVKDLITVYENDEVGTVRYIDEINTMINSEQYRRTHGEKKKTHINSEQDAFCMKLDALADYILAPENGKKHHEHSWSSKYAKEQNAGREVFINYQDDDWNYGNGISEEALDIAKFNQEQKNYINQRFSEEVKRKNRRITKYDFEAYPELISMQTSVFLMRDQLSLGDDNEAEVRNKYIKQYDGHMKQMKEHAFSCWKSGQTRIDLRELRSNPYKFDLLQLEEVTEPIIDEELLEKKFAKLLYYYGLPMDGKVAYNKLKKIVNEVNYEISVVKDQLRKPIRNSGYKPRVANPNFIPNQQFHEITLGNPDHVFGLFTFVTDCIKVADGEGKQVRFKRYIPLYRLLKDTYGEWAGNHVYHLLGTFERAVESAVLDDMQRDVVNVVLQREAFNDEYVSHPYERAAQYVEKMHGVKLENRDIKRKLEQVSKLVATRYRTN